MGLPLRHGQPATPQAWEAIPRFTEQGCRVAPLLALTNNKPRERPLLVSPDFPPGIYPAFFLLAFILPSIHDQQVVNHMRHGLGCALYSISREGRNVSSRR
jgi:hypothetical protein